MSDIKFPGSIDGSCRTSPSRTILKRPVLISRQERREAKSWKQTGMLCHSLDCLRDIFIFLFPLSLNVCAILSPVAGTSEARDSKRVTKEHKHSVILVQNNKRVCTLFPSNDSFRSAFGENPFIKNCGII